MGRRVAGTAYIKVDGIQLVVTGAIECPLNDKERESIDGAPGYFSEKDRQPFVRLEALHTYDFPIEKITQGTDMTVQAELNNGKSYVLSGAYLVGESDSESEEGKISLEFNGESGKWL